MKLIVGLGNPGKKYEKTRHNMGFMVADLFADETAIDVDKEVFHGLLGRGKFLDEDIMIFKPTTYMNLSGTAVREIVSYFKIELDDIIIVCDDMALEPGKIRLRTGVLLVDKKVYKISLRILVVKTSKEFELVLVNQNLMRLTMFLANQPKTKDLL